MIDLTINCKEITTIITDFLKTYVKQSGAKGIVLGLSGGIDSAVTALLCTRAIGSKKVMCLFLPDTTTPTNDRNHYQQFIKEFNIQSEELNISTIVQHFSKTLNNTSNVIDQANLKARIRMTMLYHYTNCTNTLVCGTSNKSELLVGYFTKYGDGGVDIFPLGDLYKTQIYQVAHFLHLPKEMITKAPQAGLWHGQTDENELGMTYETLDKILYGLEVKLPLQEIQKSVTVGINDIKRIQNMRKTSQHKRRSPLVPKIGVRTPGLDWRAPVLEG